MVSMLFNKVPYSGSTRALSFFSLSLFFSYTSAFLSKDRTDEAFYYCATASERFLRVWASLHPLMAAARIDALQVPWRLFVFSDLGWVSTPVLMAVALFICHPTAYAVDPTATGGPAGHTVAAARAAVL